MKYNIKVSKISKSRLGEIDFNNVPFGTTFSDHMFVADYIDGQWTNLEIKAYGPITMGPANLALHYGQAIFEGMKAVKGIDGNAYLYRPEMHAKRLNHSAERMCMATVPEDLFLEAVQLLVGLDSEWIPPSEGSALYIRPFLFASDEMFKVRVSKSYKFIIFTGPVGPYYAQPVSLLADDYYVRAAEGGVGFAKAAGNYGASLLPAQEAHKKGFDQIMWLDAKEHKIVQEVGTMNIFFVVDGKVITPATDTGTILKGITRDSVITLLKDKGYELIEKHIDINDLIAAHHEGKLTEVFGSGTAAVIANVKSFTYKGETITLPPVEKHLIANMLKKEINSIRALKSPDKFGWMVKVNKPVLV